MEVLDYLITSSTNMGEYKNVEFLNSPQVKYVSFNAGNNTITALDNYFSKTAISGGGNTISLPTIGAFLQGQYVTIKDSSGTAGANNLTIDANGTDTIDGAGTYVINTNYGFVSLMSDGISEWQVFSN